MSRQLVWSKVLTASDAQRTSSNQTGGVRLTRTGWTGIDHATFFRHQLFASYPWMVRSVGTYAEHTSVSFAVTVLGVLITEEQDKLLHGGKGTDGLLTKYGQSLHQDEREERYVIPAYAQHAGPDYLGIFLFTGGEKMVEHYVSAGMAEPGEFKVMRLPDSNMDGLHFAGLVGDASEQWLSFTAFCRKHGVEFTLPKFYLIIDRE